MSGQVTIRKTAGKPVREFTGRTMAMWLGGFFAVIFTANAIFIWLAFDSRTGLEVESSYKAGQGYQREIDAARLQAERGWNFSANVVRAADGEARVRIQARDRNDAPLTSLPLTATLHRPTQSAEDRGVSLIEGEAGVYSGRVDRLAAGQWDLLIEALDENGVRFRSKNRVFLSE